MHSIHVAMILYAKPLQHSFSSILLTKWDGEDNMISERNWTWVLLLVSVYHVRGHGNHCNISVRIAAMIAEKHSKPYSRTMHWITCRLSFSLLGSEIESLQSETKPSTAVLEKLDESKSVGLDGLSPRMLKQCATACPLNALDTTVPDDCKEWYTPKHGRSQEWHLSVKEGLLFLQANICATDIVNHRVWWRGLLTLLWAVGVRGRAFKLASSYLYGCFFYGCDQW